MFRHSSAAANSSDVQNYTMSNRGLLFLLHSRVLNRVLGVFAALALLPLILILSFAGWVIVGPKFLCRHARIGIDGKAFSLLSFRTIPLESSRDDRRANAGYLAEDVVQRDQSKAKAEHRHSGQQQSGYQ